MAKQVRTEDVDRISNLPDSVLSHILPFLSIKEAVRTSILSSRWRYRFALLRNLDFDLRDKLLCKKKTESLTIKSFLSFVDRIMFLYNATSIEKFRLNCWLAVDSSRIYGWLSAAFWRGVQHLDLYIHIDKFTTLPHVLFTCKALVTLKLNLSSNFFLNVPNDVYFPNVKTLHLNSIKFLNDDSVKRLFSSCTSLEEMDLTFCSLSNISQFNSQHLLLKRLTLMCCQFLSYNWIVIDAPMLMHFKYIDNVAVGYLLKNLQSLVSADIDIAIMDAELETSDHCQTDATSLFRGICNVQSLNLSSIGLESLLSCESVPLFPNMVPLKISYEPLPVSRYYHFLGKGLATLLKDSPELENLAFFQKVVSYLPEKVHSCLLFKAKAIEILEFKNEEYCIEMAKYFLKNAGVLEKLTIYTTPDLAEKKN